MWFILHGLFAFIWCYLTIASVNEFIIGLLFGTLVITPVARMASGVRYERMCLALARLFLLLLIYIPRTLLSGLLGAQAIPNQPKTVCYQPKTPLVWPLVVLINMTTHASAHANHDGTLTLLLYTEAYPQEQVCAFIRDQLESAVLLQLAGYTHA